MAAILTMVVTPSVLVPFIVLVFIIIFLSIIMCYCYHRNKPRSTVEERITEKVADADIEMDKKERSADIKLKKKKQEDVHNILDTLQDALMSGSLDVTTQVKTLDILGGYVNSIEVAPGQPRPPLADHGAQQPPAITTSIETAFRGEQGGEGPKKLLPAIKGGSHHSDSPPSRESPPSEAGTPLLPQQPFPPQAGQNIYPDSTAEYANTVSQQVVDKLAEVTEMVQSANERIQRARMKSSVQATIAVGRFKAGHSPRAGKK